MEGQGLASHIILALSRFPGLRMLCLNNYLKVTGLIRRGIRVKPELMIHDGMPYQCGRNRVSSFGLPGPGTGLGTADVFQGVILWVLRA